MKKSKRTNDERPFYENGDNRYYLANMPREQRRIAFLYAMKQLFEDDW